MLVGIEIGGTKLQFALGNADGQLTARWRGTIVPADGASGIREQIAQNLPPFLAKHTIASAPIDAIGIGFGGPIDHCHQTILKSHQVSGWDGFPLAQWLQDTFGYRAVLGNDADVAGLAEAMHGAGQGYDPIFYVTIGSGIGGGFIQGGRIHTGVGYGAAEIGHLRLPDPEHPGNYCTLESLASGWGISNRARQIPGVSPTITTADISHAIHRGEPWSLQLLDDTCVSLAEAFAQVIALLCPARIVIGGGVSLIGSPLFERIHHHLSSRVFAPFHGLTEIVPAQLGEEVVLHGAIELAQTVHRE